MSFIQNTFLDLLRLVVREDNILPYYSLYSLSSLAFPCGEGGPLAVDEEIGVLKAKHRVSDNKSL